MINLTVTQKANIELILDKSIYCHKTKNRDQIFAMVDGNELNETTLQAHINNFDLWTPLRTEAINRITKQSEDYVESVILSNYPKYEVDTWAYQRKDADAYQLNNSTPTPDIDKIATAKGKDRLTQIQRTVEKVAEYRDFIYNVIGKKQNLIDDIKTSIDEEYLLTVRFEL